MTKSNKILIYSFLLGTIFSVIIIKHGNIECLFKDIFNIPCPGCGLTRAFKAFLSLNWSMALYYNYLVFPILLIWIYCCFLVIKDVLYKENNLFDFYNQVFVKHYKIVIIMVIIAFFLNVIHQI